MYKWFTKIRKLITSNQAKRVAIALGGAFVLLNAVTYLAYRQRTYPNTTINSHRVGSITSNQLPQKVNNLKLVPNEIALTYKDKTSTVKVSDLGVQLDNSMLISQASRRRSWLPIFNFFSSHKLSLPLKVDKPTFDKAFNILAQTHRQDPVDAQITIVSGMFALRPESAGYKLNDSTTRTAILTALGQEKSKTELPVEIVQPAVKQDQLKATLNSLQKQQSTSVIFRYQSKTKKLTSQEIAGWYVPSNGSFVLSDTQIKSLIANTAANFGIIAQNINEAVGAAKQAVQKAEALDFTLVPIPVSRYYTYCVRLKNVDTSYQAGMESKLNAVYLDGRGWALGGQVSYTQVNSGCNFTVWLAAADQMASFGTICDANWSCAVGSSVIINFDRWRYASTAWNNGGGNLEDYRSMVINHETGHWLGFGHRNCGGVGQLAPVMQQQSIDLQGCKFNPWPIVTELTTLRSWLNI